MNVFDRFPSKIGLLLFAVLLALTGLSRSSTLPANAAPAEPESKLVNALLLTDSQSNADQMAVVDRVRQAGGIPLTTFPNQGMLIQLDSDNANAIRGQKGVRLLTMSAALLADAGVDPGAQDAIKIWNKNLADKVAGPQELTELPARPDNELLIPPELENPPASHEANDLPLPWQTSEFMAWNVNVDVILVESRETWSIFNWVEDWVESDVDAVMAQVNNGLSWWVSTATQGGRPTAFLNFSINYWTPFNHYDVVTVDYQPIKLSSQDDRLWINQVMGNLGFNTHTGSNDDYNNVRDFNAARRAQTGKDWSVTIFIVDSWWDGDGTFEDGRFAYSYLYGPYTVMTWGNDGWGIDNMQMVTAHETAHLFGSLDEYAESDCTPTQISGYLGIQNTNCENGTPTENSIMRSSGSQFVAYPNHLASTPVRGMIGWRDSDQDGLYDPIDTTPSLSLTGSSTTTYITDTTVSLTGSASDPPCPSPTRYTADVNFILGVVYRVNESAWIPCSATDGAFNNTLEAYTCTAADLKDGSYFFEVATLNRSMVQSILPFPFLTIIRDTTGPKGSLIVNGGLPYTNKAEITLEPSASDVLSLVTEMCISNDSAECNNWEPYSSIPELWQLSVEDGEKTVYIQYKDARGNLSSSYSGGVILDTVAPEGSIVINEGADFTNTGSVSLGLTASHAIPEFLMHFSNDGETWSDWTTFASSQGWTLAEVDGEKTVYAQFKDLAGNESTVYSDAILLDTTAPLVTVEIPFIDRLGVVTVSWSSVEEGSGGLLYDVQFRIGTDGVWTDWWIGTQKTSTSFGPQVPGSDLPLTYNSKIFFRIRARDAAGNQSDYVEKENIIIDKFIFLPVLKR
jgi:hypothetical protein